MNSIPWDRGIHRAPTRRPRILPTIRITLLTRLHVQLREQPQLAPPDEIPRFLWLNDVLDVARLGHLSERERVRPRGDRQRHPELVETRPVRLRLLPAFVQSAPALGEHHVVRHGGAAFALEPGLHRLEVVVHSLREPIGPLGVADRKQLQDLVFGCPLCLGLAGGFHLGDELGQDVVAFRGVVKGGLVRQVLQKSLAFGRVHRVADESNELSEDDSAGSGVLEIDHQHRCDGLFGK